MSSGAAITRPRQSGAEAAGTADEATLRRMADTLLELPYAVWSFGDSVAFEAMIAASDVLGDQRWLRFAHGVFRGWGARARPYSRLDCTAPGLAMVDAYRRTGDSRILEAAIGLAEYLVSRPRLNGVYATWEHSPLQHPFGPGRLPSAEVQLLAQRPPGVFIDCLHFDPPFFAALGAVTGEDRWTAEGAGQALGYVRLLQEDTGLFAHFILEGSPRRYGSGWGRGQGWALLGLLNVLAELGHDHAARGDLEAAAKMLAAAMLRLQRPDGHWYAVADDPESGDETSTAAFMAAALPAAGQVTGLAGTQAGASAALAAARDATTPEGTVTGVSAAVNACTQISHYAHVPRGFVVPWGQGPLVLALAGRLSNGETTDEARP